MRNTVLFTLTLAGAALLVGPAAAKEIYVDNVAGDDTYFGSQLANLSDRTGPVRTIEKALRLAGPSDRIVLANTGVAYRESLSLMGSQHSGSALRPFVIEGNGAILDGSAPVPPDAWENYQGAVFRFRPPHVEFQQFFLNDRPAPRVPVSGNAEEPPELQPLQWCLHRGYIYFCVEPLHVPEHYVLSYAARQVGITLYHVQQVQIRDLIVQAFQLDGISAFNSARQIQLQGVTVRGNGRSGLTTGGASLVDIQASLLGNNGHVQLLTRPWSETHVRNSELLSNTGPAWIDEGGKVFIDGKQVEGGLDEFKPAK